MKKIVASLCASMFLAAPTAFGTTTRQSIPVQARVKASCTIAITPLAFGDYDPNALADLTGTGTISLSCSKNATVKLSLDDGEHPVGTQRNMKAGSSADTLSYNVEKEDASGTRSAWGSGVDAQTVTATGGTDAVTIYGTIPNSQPASQDFYDDTVTLTVTY